MMEKKKVVVVAGTRPEVIKMASVYMELQCSDLLEPVLLSTGQHRETVSYTHLRAHETGA